MDVSQIGIAVSLLSVSIAVIKTSWDGKKNNKGGNCNPNYVKRDDCHSAMDSINKRIDDHNLALNTRIGDLCSKVDMAINLIKNGK